MDLGEYAVDATTFSMIEPQKEYNNKCPHCRSFQLH